MVQYSEREWFPESLFSNWIADSLILMTSSLLFYHMTQKESLIMDYRLAGIFAVSLILCSICMAIVSLYPYYQRMGVVLKDEHSEQAKKENVYRIIYTILGSIIITVQFAIAFFIIKGIIMKKKL